MLLPARRRLGVALLAVLTVGFGLGLSSATPASAAPNTSAYALTAAGGLVPLTITPGSPPVVAAGTAVPVSGLTDGRVLVGLDFRPATGALVGVGVNPTSGSASVYTVAAATGVATPVGTAFTVAPGASWGMDFNPTVDRIRLIGDAGGNYRIHPDTGALTTDGALAFVAGDPKAGGLPLVVASAGYTNSFGAGSTTPTGPKATTLFALDGGNDVLVAVDNPNSGETRTVGALGADIDLDAELDVTTNGLAYALVSVGGTEVLRTVNLGSGALGAASAPLALGSPVTGLAIETGTSPVVPGDDGYAVTEAGALVTFELATPGATTTVGPITGLPAGFKVEGLDTRPLNGALYAIAIKPGSNQGQLAIISRSSAAATLVGTPFAVAPATDYGFDFNPTVDRIRFVTSAGANLRLHPDTGAVAATDGTLAYNAGDAVTVAPNLTSTAYSNSFGGAAGTIHYGIDATQDTLAVFTDSNGGKLRTVRKLALAGMPPTPVDVVGDTGLDVATDGRMFVAGQIGGVTQLFTANPVTAVLTPVVALPASSAIGTGATVRAFVISGNFVPRTVTTLEARPLIQISGGKVSINIGEVAARLRTVDGTPVPGAAVVFRAGTATLCTGTTDVDGLARCTTGLGGIIRILLAGGYTAAYGGSEVLSPASGSAGIVG